MVATVFGYEPAYWSDEFAEYVIEPGYARPTKAEAEQQLRDDQEIALQLRQSEREYATGMAYACGYRD